MTDDEQILVRETVEGAWMALDRAVAEAARRTSDATLHAAIAATPDAVVITDADGRFLHCNDAFVAFHRLPSKEAFVGTLPEAWPSFEFLPGDGSSASFGQRPVGRALRGETQINVEYRVRRTDTGEQWIGSYSFAPIRDSSDRVTGAVIVGRDISAQKQAELELNREKEKQRYLLSLSDALHELSDPGEIMSAAARRIGEQLGANRALYATIDDGQRVIVRAEYVRGGRSLAGTTYSVPFSFEGRVLEDLRREGEVVLEDVATDPRLTEDGRAHLRGQEVAAGTAALLVRSGKWAGALIVHSATPRTWTALDRMLVRETADRTWAALERAEADAARREFEQRYAALFDHSPVPTSLMRASDSVRVNANSAFAALFELDADELTGARSVDQGLWSGETALALGGVRGLECTSRTRSGKALTLVVDQTPVTLAGEGYFLTTIRDITAQRRAEASLHERDRTLRLLLRTAVQGILSVDADGKILTANRAVESMFGWEEGTLAGELVDVLLPQRLRETHVALRQAYALAPMPRPMGVGRDLVGQRKDGTPLAIEVSLSHAVTPTGPVTFAFVSDITERRKSDLELRERTAELNRRTRQLSRLTSELTIAEQHAREQLSKTLHDGLQQLLFAAKITLDRARKRTNSDPRTAELLTKVRADLDDAIASARSLSMELFPRALHDGGLVPAIHWLAGWMWERYGLRVELDLDPRVSVERDDARILIYESIRELLFNAVKHAKVDQVHVTVALDDDETVCVEVLDRGVGFDSKALFEREDLHHVGTGLLTIRERLALLGGSLEVESASGKGSTFRLILPCSGAADLRWSRDFRDERADV